MFEYNKEKVDFKKKVYFYYVLLGLIFKMVILIFFWKVECFNIEIVYRSDWVYVGIFVVVD